MKATATTMKTAEAPPRPVEVSALNNPPQDSAGQVKRLHHIPFPETKEATRQWQLQQMAGAFRIFAKLGFADGGSGHISLRDPVNTDTFWINPYGVHFGLLKVSDMVHVDGKGNRIGGADKPVNTAGFIIHSALHQRRPDINAACHLHSPYGRAWSTFGREIDMLNQGRTSLNWLGGGELTYEMNPMTDVARFVYVL